MLIFVMYAILAIIIFIYAFYAVKSLRHKDSKGKLLSFCCLTCIALTLFAFVSYFSANKMIIGVARSLMSISVDWTLFFVLEFVFVITGRKPKREVELTVAGFLCLDTVFLLTNPINAFTFSITQKDCYGMTFPVVVPGVMFYFHLSVLYLMLLQVEVVLIYTAFKSSIYYRVQYWILGIIFVICAFLNRSFAGRVVLMDLTVIVNCIALMSLYYVTYYFSPLRLLRNLQLYVNDNILDATLLYDMDDRLLLLNRPAKEVLEDNIYANAESLHEFLGYPGENERVKKIISGRCYEVNFKKVYDKKRILVGKVFILHDITEMESMLEREHEAATTDPLTGAYNRIGFFEASDDFLYRHDSEHGFALIVSGIVGFKEINSSFGSNVGDVVLKEIAKRYHNYHHSYPMIYGRTAEGKFACLVPFEYVDELTADMTLLTIHMDKDADVHVEMCHGFIIMDDVSKPIGYYYERALIALALCKKKATTPVLEYSVEMEEGVRRRQQLLGEMHEALKEKQFFIELQPQMDVVAHKVCGAEALVRWQHPKLGRISPGEFIPLFEDNGFIPNLDIFVWETAAKTQVALQRDGIYDGPISVNVSQIDISEIDVVGVLKRIVKETGIEISKLHVEITESACAHKLEHLVKIMKELRETGFIVEIDDFGSGYSSLNALMYLPFDVVKLDMAFMRESRFSEKREVIIQAMTKMIFDLKAGIIVEGVETEEGVNSCMSFGGNVIQGYYFSKPLGIEAFKEYVKEHNA